jgi:uncharacterized membrane protein
MTIKKYQRVKIVVTVILAVIFSQAVVYNNYLIPLVAMIIASLVLIYLRRQVKEVIADERDYAIAGKAALWSIQIYSWVATISMIVLYALRDLNPAYEPVAMTLAFSTCGLMLLYAVIFRYHNNFKFSDKKTLYMILVIALLFAAAIVTMRVFSGEDDWICVNGKWEQHGHPDFPAPQAECK